MLTPPQPGPFLVVLSGPSGVGKDTVLDRLKELKFPFHYVVTATTRPRRSGERNGREYHFHTQADFKQMIAGNELIEWAEVYGNFYGIPRREIEAPLRAGQDTIVRVDVQGSATIKRLLPGAIFVFLVPLSMDELARRLRLRKSESEADLSHRLRKAEQEMATLPMFDYVVVNEQDRLDRTIGQIEAILTAERCRVQPRVIRL